MNNNVFLNLCYAEYNISTHIELEAGEKAVV